MSGHIPKLCLLSIALMAGCSFSSAPKMAPIEPRAHDAHREWGQVTFKKIGLAIEVPNWNAEIEEHSNLWTLFGFPLVDNPTAGTQYCVTIQITKMAKKSFRLSRSEVKDEKEDLQTWINLSHPTTSQQSDSYWIYIRRDIVTDGGYVYMVSAKIKRVGEKWEFNVKDRVADYRVIAEEANQLIDSINPIK